MRRNLQLPQPVWEIAIVPKASDEVNRPPTLGQSRAQFQGHDLFAGNDAGAAYDQSIKHRLLDGWTRGERYRPRRTRSCGITGTILGVADTVLTFPGRLRSTGKKTRIVKSTV